MKRIHSWESVFGKMDGKGGGVVASDATAANGLFGTVGTKMKVLGENYGIKNSTVFFCRPAAVLALQWEVLNPAGLTRRSAV